LLSLAVAVVQAQQMAQVRAVVVQVGFVQPSLQRVAVVHLKQHLFQLSVLLTQSRLAQVVLVELLLVHLATLVGTVQRHLLQVQA
jgi:hypothetical protein